MPPTLPVLSLLETRVLGVLAEKQRTVPDSYPLTLNALVSGCNQKSSRDPVIEATEAEVQAALDSLRALSLIVETSGGRAAGWRSCRASPARAKTVGCTCSPAHRSLMSESPPAPTLQCPQATSP